MASMAQGRITQAASAPPMGVTEAIRRRRATRAFTGEHVGKTAVETLLDAAVRAPTAMHEEPWAFAVIQDPAVLERLSDDVRQSLAAQADRPHGLSGFALPDNVFYDAGTLIVIYGKPLGRFVVADCWLAAENLMLAACSLGFGTCVIGLSVDALNTPEWKAELKVPAEMTAYAPIIVGVPRGEAAPTSRNDPRILSWIRSA